MKDRALFDFRLRRHAVRLSLGLAVLLVLPAQAAEPETLARSETPQTLEGEGDRMLLVEGPFSLEWRTAAGSFAVKVTAVEAPAGEGGATVLSGTATTAAAGATTGQGNGRIKVGGAKRYSVAITASGPWSVTVSW